MALIIRPPIKMCIVFLMHGGGTRSLSLTFVKYFPTAQTRDMFIQVLTWHLFALTKGAAMNPCALRSWLSIQVGFARVNHFLFGVFNVPLL